MGRSHEGVGQGVQGSIVRAHRGGGEGLAGGRGPSRRNAR